MRTRKMRRVRARYYWDRLEVSFWFAPVVMSLGAILLAWYKDQVCKELIRHIDLILAESQAGALIEQDRRLIQRRGEALLVNFNQ